MTLLVTMLFSFLVIVTVIGAMGIGVMNGRDPIRGSCGGIGAGGCELCKGNCRDNGRRAGEQKCRR